MFGFRLICRLRAHGSIRRLLAALHLLHPVRLERLRVDDLDGPVMESGASVMSFTSTLLDGAEGRHLVAAPDILAACITRRVRANRLDRRRPDRRPDGTQLATAVSCTHLNRFARGSQRRCLGTSRPPQRSLLWVSLETHALSTSDCRPNSRKLATRDCSREKIPRFLWRASCAGPQELFICQRDNRIIAGSAERRIKRACGGAC
jgi:hypothetical protein